MEGSKAIQISTSKEFDSKLKSLTKSEEELQRQRGNEALQYFTYDMMNIKPL